MDSKETSGVTAESNTTAKDAGLSMTGAYQERPGIPPIADGKVRVWNYSAKRRPDQPVLSYLTVA